MQCESSAWYARAGRCLVSPTRLRRSCAVWRTLLCANAHCPTTTTLPLRTTGPAAARTSACDASAKRAGVPPPHRAPILQFPDPKLPYTVVTDASQIAVGGVLMQDHSEGLKPLVFLSRQLKPTEQRYSAYERELAAVAYCFLAWRHYLEDCLGGVTVITDHQMLTRIMDQQVLSRAQIRWVWLGLLQSIRPTIKYQLGKANIVADALNRSQRGTSDADVEDQGLH